MLTRQRWRIAFVAVVILGLSSPPHVGFAEPSPKDAGTTASLWPDPIVVTRENVIEFYHQHIKTVRQEMSKRLPEIVPLLDRANDNFDEYVKLDCVKIPSKYYEGGSAARTFPPYCYERAYIGRLQIICPLYNPLLRPAERCVVRDQSESGGD